MTNVNSRHPKQAFLYATGRALERGSFYGTRGLLLLYLITQVKVGETEASRIYGIFIGSLTFAHIIGAVLGDLLLGNKKAFIIGGVLQTAGIFCLCMPTITGIYAGLSLVVIGNGLFTPNMLSNFGKLYSHSRTLIDAGFGLNHTAMSIGAAIGITLTTFLGYKNPALGFASGGLLMLASVVVSFFLEEKGDTRENKPEVYTISLQQQLLAVTSLILLVAIFWYVYEFSYTGIEYIQYQFPGNSFIAQTPLEYDAIFLIPMGIILTIIWTFSFSTTLRKIAVGFLIGALSLGMLLFIPQDFGFGATLLFLSAMFLLSVAELYIGPMLYSAITQYSNPKFLAIIISLTYIPSRLAVYIMAIVINEHTSGWISLIIGSLILAVIGISLLIFSIVKNKRGLVN